YDDEVQKYDRPHLSNAPEWSYIIQQQDLIFDTNIDQGTTPATGNTTKNDEDHNKEGEEKPSKSTVSDNHNNSDSNLHMDDAQ
ncbi:20763_t:CDS:2, partial [Rhizophagus irregularis]